MHDVECGISHLITEYCDCFTSNMFGHGRPVDKIAWLYDVDVTSEYDVVWMLSVG